MADLIRIRSALFQLLKQATEESVKNISAPNSPGVMEVDKFALTAMMVLLRFHPEEDTGKFYNDKIFRLISGLDIVMEHPESKPRLPTVIGSVIIPACSGDPYMEGLDAIMEYGKFYSGWKDKNKKDSA